jgi:hypothetical protein
VSESLAGCIAGAVAFFLTLVDLDRTFYIPAKVPQKISRYLWWFGFPLANGVLAGLLYSALSDLPALKTMPAWSRALAVGAGYLALVRLKFTTLDMKGKEIPFGLELIYEAAKGFAYKRINRIAMTARFAETVEMADKLSLAELTARVKLAIEQNSLLTPEDRSSLKAWLLRTIQDANSTDIEKRQALANYVLSGKTE